MTPSTSVAYDATLVLATGCNQAFTSSTISDRVTVSGLESRISHEDIIGISGRIVFNGSRDPFHKITVTITIMPAPKPTDKNNFYFVYGKFSEGNFV